MGIIEFNALVAQKKAELVKYLFDNDMMRGGKDWAKYKQEQLAQHHTAPQVRKC